MHLLLRVRRHRHRAGQVRRLPQLYPVLAQRLGDVLDGEHGSAAAGGQRPGGDRRRSRRRCCSWSSSCSSSSSFVRRPGGGSSCRRGRRRSRSRGRCSCPAGSPGTLRRPPALDLERVGGDRCGEALRGDGDDTSSETFFFSFEELEKRVSESESERVASFLPRQQKNTKLPLTALGRWR